MSLCFFSVSFVPLWSNSGSGSGMTSKRDYYEVLEIERGADGDSITKAYRRLAMKYHPDRNGGGKGAEDKFKKAAQGDDLLRAPGKRGRHRRHGHPRPGSVNRAPRFNY